jgi:hypothetical protein
MMETKAIARRQPMNEDADNSPLDNEVADVAEGRRRLLEQRERILKFADAVALRLRSEEQMRSLGKPTK